MIQELWILLHEIHFVKEVLEEVFGDATDARATVQSARLAHFGMSLKNRRSYNQTMIIISNDMISSDCMPITKEDERSCGGGYV